MKDKKILKPGKNCWRMEKADRVAILVDGKDYFKALQDAFSQAQRSIFIVGWDVNSQISLVPNHRSHKSLPLGDFLRKIILSNPCLHIYVLTWDFAAVYGLDREWLPIFGLGWPSHRRLHFHMDDQHPIGASQHQKMVVIDDQLAFVGGVDLTKGRWDTSDHSPDNPLRMDLGENHCPPFHDVQMMVSGEVATAIGDLVRERWFRATGKPLKLAPKEKNRNLWPWFVQPDTRNVEIGIARTSPFYAGYPEVREVERLYLDMIAQAQQSIYFENQYFTSHAIGKAIIARLADPKGPEIVLVSPLKTQGWMAQHTMDVFRGRLLKKIRSADRFGRFRAYYPTVPDLGDQNINMHSKVAVVDDCLVRVGSSNICNRSMGLDSECDLVIEATPERRDVKESILHFRHRLLGEHLDVDPECVSENFVRNGSLIKALDTLRGSERTLLVLKPTISPEIDALVPESETVDAESPIEPEQLIDQLAPEKNRKSSVKKIIFVVSLVFLLLALSLIWQVTPFGEWLKTGPLVSEVKAFTETPMAPFWIIGTFVVGGLVSIPVSLLIAVTLIGFGPVFGGFYSLIGALLSGILVYGIGRMLGRSTVRFLAGSRLNRVSRRLARRGFLTVLVLRVVPLAPFSVINMVAGASHIGFRDFVMGTLVGITPGVLAMALFMDRAVIAFQEPNIKSFLVLAAVIGFIALGMFLLSRWLLKRV